MKKSIILIFIVLSYLDNFGQSIRYNDKKQLAKDMLSALMNINIPKLKSINAALVIPYSDYRKIIFPTYKEDSTKKIFDFPENEVYPTSWYIKDSILYKNYIADFYFGELYRGLLNDADNNSKFGKNIYIAFDREDDSITDDINKNYLGILYETDDYVKVVNMEALITYNNILYTMRQANYHNYSKQKLPYYLLTKMPEKIAVLKLVDNNFVPYTNDTILFENANYEEFTDFKREDYDHAIVETVDETYARPTNKRYAETTSEPEIYDRADTSPKYPGGPVEMFKFIAKKLKYPPIAKENKLEGKVLVKFYIDIDGTIKEPVVLKDAIGGGASAEAIRLVKSMPKWEPGTQNGKPVKVYYILPITFKLQ